MGQATPLISAGSKQSTPQESAVADALGNATFHFDAPPAGQVITGTLQCQGAPSGATFIATIGATQWGEWNGNSTAGPVQAWGNGEPLTVTASGLNPGTTYLLSWIGSVDDSTTIEPIFPDSTAANVTFIPPGTDADFVGSTILAGGGPSYIVVFNPQRAYDALMLLVNTTAPQNLACAQLVVNPVEVDNLEPYFVAPFSHDPTNPPPPRCIIPCSTNDLAGTGGTLTVYSVGSLAGSVVNVWGLTASAPLIRPDSRAYPLGGFIAAAQTAAGVGATLVAAPTAPLRIFIKTLSGGVSGGALIIAGTINGSSTPLVQTVGATPFAAMNIPPDGLLLDPATPLTLNANVGAVQQGNVTYDLVA